MDAAIRTAYDLGDIAAVRELLAMIDDCPPRHLAPRLLAGRTLVHARLADRDGYAAADPAFAAIGALREHSTLTTSLTACSITSGTSPVLVRSKPPKRLSARPATSPGRQRCQPLLDRVAGLTPAELRIGARWWRHPARRNPQPRDIGE